ncbi:MAG: hypothetical protein K2Y28_18065 [Burkholderiaceae bacterium]|nr:hypothetical protein [Burkholderiaceae bacterium]
MKLKEFGNAKFIVDFCSWLVVIIALFFYGSEAEFFRWASTGVFEIALLFIINRFFLTKASPDFMAR